MWIINRIFFFYKEIMNKFSTLQFIALKKDFNFRSELAKIKNKFS